MKKYTAIILSALLLLSLCACSVDITVNGGEKADGTPPPASEAPTPAVTAPPDTAAAEVTLIDADASDESFLGDKGCILDPEGMKILISFSTEVSAVTLCEIIYDDNFNFVSTGDIYAAFGKLAAGEEVGLRVFIPDVLPNVALCYQDALGQHCYGIFQSGEDGSLLLTELRTAEGFNAEGSSFD